MKLRFEYSEGQAGAEGVRPATCRVTNAETGELLERVTSVQFAMNAGDMLPRLMIEVIPSAVEIQGELAARSRFVFDAPLPGPAPDVFGRGQIT